MCIGDKYLLIRAVCESAFDQLFAVGGPLSWVELGRGSTTRRVVWRRSTRPGWRSVRLPAPRRGRLLEGNSAGYQLPYPPWLPLSGRLSGITACPWALPLTDQLSRVIHLHYRSRGSSHRPAVSGEIIYEL